MIMSDNDNTIPKHRVVDVNAWKGSWQKGLFPWHMDERHVDLVNHIDSLIAGRSNIRLFFPLCGKAVDMKWLYDEGHYIVGVEVSTLAIEAFFTENDLKYTQEKIDIVDGILFKSEDDRIHLYACDIFRFNREIEAEFDGIWDRGAFEAINLEDEPRYAALMQSLMGPNCRYLLATLEYDPSIYSGPPHYIPMEKIEALFDRCKIKQLEHYKTEIDIPEINQDLSQRLHLLIPQSLS